VKNIVVIGAGIAGIEGASILSRLGHNVTLLEKSDKTGGKVRNWKFLFPDFTEASDIMKEFDNKISTDNFTVRLKTEVVSFQKQDKKFVLQTNDSSILKADAVLISTGYNFFEAERKEEYGYKIYDNVITSVELEAMFNQNTITTKSGEIPKKIAIIHCVGSRDEKSGNHYCSKVCCVTGAKQAIEISKLLPKSEIYCFYMDLRMFDKRFEELYREAQEKYNIQFIRGRVSEISETGENQLLIKTEDTLSGRPLKMKLDMVVLLVGIEAGINTKSIGKLFSLEFDKTGFLQSKNIHTQSNISSEKGIFLAGTCISPMSVKDTLENARSAAFEVHNYLNNNI